MDPEGQLSSPFAIPDLWKKSSFADFNHDASLGSRQPLQHIVPLDDAIDDDLVKDFEENILDLQPFSFGPIEDVDALEESAISSASELDDLPPIDEQDVWTLTTSHKAEDKNSQLRSWEAFQDRCSIQYRTTYISDGGAELFDVALACLGEENGQVLQSGALLRCLVQLGLGRESILYTFNKAQGSFVSCIRDGRMSGHSLRSFNSLSDVMIKQGNIMRNLRIVTDRGPEGNPPSPSAMAVYHAVRTALSVIEAEVTDASVKVATLLQMQNLFDKPGEIIGRFSKLVMTASSASSGIVLLSKIFELVQEAEHEEAWIKHMMVSALNAAARPWRAAMGAWLGLSSTLTGSALLGNLTFAQNSTEKPADAEMYLSSGEIGEYEPSALPNFVSEDEGRVAYEIGHALRLLQKHQTDHPLLKHSAVRAWEWENAEWSPTWPGVETTTRRAQEHEKDLIKVIAQFESQPCTDQVVGRVERRFGLELTPASESGVKVSLEESVDQIEKPLSGLGPMQMSDAKTTEGGLSSSTLEVETFCPPLSMIPTLYLQPWISAQSRLVNRTCVRMLYEQFDLKAHFTLLNRYQLLGDGPFSIRLCHALFDPDVGSSERREGHHRAGVTGMRLGHRAIWPPKSSEMRLSLMGILTDSYFPDGHESRASLFRGEIPGDLSFAIRDMSDEELQRCTNPNSIFALDFLQLKYRVPSPLDAVITPAAMLKYDAIFRVLLRVKRMLFVTDRLTFNMRAFRSSHRSRAEYWLQTRRLSHRFVTCVSSYFFDAITGYWTCMHGRLLRVEEALNRGDGVFNESFFALREFHEQLLDRLMLTLFLRKRQEDVMKLLEEIFEVILEFADHGGKHSTESRSHDLYRMLCKRTTIFVRVCRGLSERIGLGSTRLDSYANHSSKQRSLSPADDGDTIGHLLLLLEMNGFSER